MKVWCNHQHDQFILNGADFAIVEEGDFNQSYRIGGDANNGYYAIATGFGCGRTCPTITEAIRSLLFSHNCFDVSYSD